MITFKAKSLVKDKTDKDIQENPQSIMFISFESVTDLFKEKYLQSDDREVIGYRVTTQGVEIVIR